ncbi:hypothetical protein LTR86_005492 [Recurvomyces mirabilis]|nr:hypothetical protein LTR86_005492 [Recurvomyces mirabilis]
MESYVDYSGSVAYQESADAQNAAYYAANGQPPMVDIKPRLTKSQHEMLESEYNKQNKPSTNVKKGFAETLGVSLDKVNNWFQNRRAKSKQDAKKAAGAYHIYSSSQGQSSHLSYASDSDTSPSYPSDDYASMMASHERSSAHVGSNNGISQNDLYESVHHGTDHTQAYAFPHQMQPEAFDSPQEYNRRTLTQEQFNAYAQNGGFMDGTASYDVFNGDFSGDQQIMRQIFPELQPGQVKQQDVYTFPCPVPPPMSSIDSSIPSTLSERSISTFPSTSSMREPTSISSRHSDWADSRSSSVSLNLPDNSIQHTMQQPVATNSQWQPGQSVPVDFDALNEQFRQASQARHPESSHQIQEQPLAWPIDDAFERRESQTSSMLAQSMGHVGLNTPQPQQNATFKTPAPPASIAARRQRPRPTPIGLAAMRSQSYSGAAQPGSPGQVPVHHLPAGAPQLRRIRSSNVVGGIAQGRVQKAMPGAPQRSPLVWNFADAASSPKILRHASSHSISSLAPPTPMSPREFQQADLGRAHLGWQASGQFNRQPSINETEIEHGLPVQHTTFPQPQNFSSPPHTPMYHQQSFMQQRINENTPPQSAPANQQSFPSQAFYVAPMPAVAPPQPHHYTNVVLQEPHFQAPVINHMPQTHVEHGMPIPEPQVDLSDLAYTQLVPIINAAGEIEMVVPPQFMQQLHTREHMPLHQPVPQMHLPEKCNSFEGMLGMFSTAPPPPPPPQVTAPIPKPSPQPPSEFFAHEYTPPVDLKRVATPRKAVDTGPKNYSFTNQSPLDFERGKRSRASATASNSPASSNGANSSS